MNDVDMRDCCPDSCADFTITTKKMANTMSWSCLTTFMALSGIGCVYSAGHEIVRAWKDPTYFGKVDHVYNAAMAGIAATASFAICWTFNNWPR